ncbi:transposase [Nonomuraea sp. NPDC046570]|uniref:transposase n=1 Tax=Nonomuraea sp. NPDC046570 TaxID=3155255 RepID=UPI003403A5CA
MIYRTCVHRGRKGERKGFSCADYAALFDAAHQQLGGPLVVVWDNLNTHVSAEMKTLIANRPWLTVFQLPAYAPELNPVEAVWAQHEEEPDQPRGARGRRAPADREEPAQTDAVPSQPDHGIHREDRIGLPTALTSAFEAL